MTAQIQYYGEDDGYVSAFSQGAFDADAAMRNGYGASVEDGELWRRVAEGKRRDG